MMILDREPDLINLQTVVPNLKRVRFDLGQCTLWIDSINEVEEVNESIFWDRKKDGCHIEPAQIFYTKTNKKIIIPAREILDDDYGKNKKRNDTIESIRDKFMKKSRKHGYEHLGDWTYKSPQAYRQFLKEVEKYVRKSKPVRSTIKLMGRDYDFGRSSDLCKEDVF
jgi:hypothetical protein